MGEGIRFFVAAYGKTASGTPEPLENPGSRLR